MPTESVIFTGLRAFVLDALPALAASGGTNVRQGQQNDVPMPPGPDFVFLTPADRSAMATTTREYTPSVESAPALGTRETGRSTQIGVQCDFYGPNAADNAQVFTTLFRDLHGCDFLRTYEVQPLFCDDGRQMPLVDSEKQYETRWMVRAVMQANPSVSTSQDFADTLATTTVEAD